MTAKTWIPANPIGLPSAADTAFVRAWIEEFRQAMLDIGLVQAGDTGQFDVGTFSYSHPGGSSTPVEFTYLMFALSDDLHNKAPIYIRVGFFQAGYGAGAINGRAVISEVAAGVETDGVGGFVGLSTAKVRTGPYTSSPSGWLPQYNLSAQNQSFACRNTEKGFLGVVLSPGSRFCTQLDQRYAPVCFFIERVPDEFGNPTTDGFTLWASPTSQNTSTATDIGNSQGYPGITTATAQTVMTSTGFVSGARSHSVPYNDASSILTADGDIYLNHAYHITPHPVRSVGLAAIASGHGISHGTQLEFTPYGTEPSNFVAINWTPAFRLCAATTNANPVLLFE